MATVPPFVEQLRSHVPDEASYGRLYADFHDLIEICEWFLSAVKANDKKNLTASELEDLLVEIDVSFLEHAAFHLGSLKRELTVVLEKLAEEG